MRMPRGDAGKGWLCGLISIKVAAAARRHRAGGDSGREDGGDAIARSDERGGTGGRGGLRRLAILLLPLLVLATAALAAASPEQFVQRVEARFDAVRATGAGGREAACRSLVADLFDIRAIAEGTGGPGWKGFAASAKAALEAAVRHRLGGECVDVAERPSTGPGTIRRVKEIAGGIRLTVQFPREGGGADGAVFVWTLRAGGALGFTARDLSVDGRGLVAALRADLDAALAVRGGDVAAAIADLDRSRRK